MRAASEDLQRLSRADWETYLAFCNYIPQGERQFISGSPMDAPVALARYRLDGGGFLIARKTLSTQRAGTFFVHGIVDAEGAIDPLRIAASNGADFWLTSDEGLARNSTLLPPLDAAIWARVLVPAASTLGIADEELALVVQAWAQAHEEGTTGYIRGEGITALPAIQALLMMLPRRLAETVCFSTYEAAEDPRGIDVLGTARPIVPSPPTEWARTLVRLRSDRAALEAIHDDTRIATVPDLVGLIYIRSGTVLPKFLQGALEHRSFLLTDLLARHDVVELVIRAVGEDPIWWRDHGIALLTDAAHAICAPSFGELLRASLSDLQQGRHDAALTMMALYRELENDLEARRRQLQLAATSFSSDIVAEGARELLNDKVDLPAAAFDAWVPFLACRHSRIGVFLDGLPAGAHAAVLEQCIAFGQQDYAPSLSDIQLRRFGAAVAALAERKWLGAPLSRFVVRVLKAQPNPDESLRTILRQERLAPEFLRRHLASALTAEFDAAELSDATYRDFATAAVADFPELASFMMRSTQRQGQSEPSRGNESSGPLTRAYRAWRLNG